MFVELIFYGLSPEIRRIVENLLVRLRVYLSL